MSVQEVDGSSVEEGFQSVLSVMARDGKSFDPERVREGLSKLVAIRPGVAFSASGCYINIPGHPIHGEGKDLDGALTDLVGELREYSQAWHIRLNTAPNHRDSWGLVMLTDLSTDEQLHAWLASL
jgi:hypothetical protein